MRPLNPLRLRPGKDTRTFVFPYPHRLAEILCPSRIPGTTNGLQTTLRKNRIGISGKRHLYLSCPPAWTKRNIRRNPNDILFCLARHITRTAIQPPSLSHVLRCLDTMRDECTCVYAYKFPVGLRSQYKACLGFLCCLRNRVARSLCGEAKLGILFNHRTRSG